MFRSGVCPEMACLVVVLVAPSVCVCAYVEEGVESVEGWSEEKKNPPPRKRGGGEWTDLDCSENFF